MKNNHLIQFLFREYLPHNQAVFKLQQISFQTINGTEIARIKEVEVGGNYNFFSVSPIYKRVGASHL